MRIRNWTIIRQLGSGFGLILMLLVVLASISYIGINSIVHNAKLTIEGNKLDAMMAQREIDHLNWVNTLSSLLTDENVSSLNIEKDPTHCGFGQWYYGSDCEETVRAYPSLKPLLADIEAPHKRLHEAATEVEAVFGSPHGDLYKHLEKTYTAHLTWVNTVSRKLAMMASVDKDEPSAGFVLNVETDPHACALGRFIGSKQAKKVSQEWELFASFVEDIIDPHERLHGSALEIEALVRVGDIASAVDVFTQRTEPALEEIKQLFQVVRTAESNNIDGYQAAGKIYAEHALPALAEVKAILNGIREEARKHVVTDEAMLSAAESTNLNVASLAAVIVLIGITLTFFVCRKIRQSLLSVSNQLSVSLSELSSASSQLSSGSQNLAQGVSEQAASLEEISSSFEEMSSMAKLNNESVQKADQLTHTTTEIVDNAYRSMKTLTQSMEDIIRFSEETKSIIKTIDDIAFQTNILALNAAVEAARAGSVGAGFSVVADEVRGLALRSTEAAKSTASLIENTSSRITEGNELTKEAYNAFALMPSSA